MEVDIPYVWGEISLDNCITSCDPTANSAGIFDNPELVEDTRRIPLVSVKYELRLAQITDNYKHYSLTHSLKQGQLPF